MSEDVEINCGDRRPWYRQETPPWTWDSCSEFNRLFDAAGRAGLALVPLALAAHILADRRDCSLAEAWDRLAFNLETMLGDRVRLKPDQTLGKMRPAHCAETGPTMRTKATS